MRSFKQKKGLGDQLADVLVSVFTDSNANGNGNVKPRRKPKGNRLGGLGSAAAGAALFTTARGLASARSNGKPETVDPEDDEHLRTRVRVR